MHSPDHAFLQRVILLNVDKQSANYIVPATPRINARASITIRFRIMSVPMQGIAENQSRNDTMPNPYLRQLRYWAADELLNIAIKTSSFSSSFKAVHLTRTTIYIELPSQVHASSLLLCLRIIFCR